ncbi:MAG TPA: aldose 1-epimerase family protein [Candidatus Sumerlaeota bacterium]|nr:aldose 1-epimerase family protein [Candidatus Sumerlaeota bacterium]HON50075.1 aldose 1-epimerase family protein [Candidatus Sumerlaeota bacterium]HOR63291.1 aldose 1-epimerase family protein [Candidatus Sumerlaeota bacterium]HPL74042.1 aldose 1-epimerase family protein [Candidatus Sumerlaeota bacterium]HRU54220.1 aldose 1-epimerase family protein [Candidatus Sumerlaeia bacterium]
MAQLYGREWTKKELLRRIGSLGQVGGVRLFEYSDGASRGLRAAEIRTGSGLSFTILLDRGMDIGSVEFAGCPLNWESSVGFKHPAFFHHNGLDWLNTFGGGLVTTCGLSNVGVPNTDEGRDYGLHGCITACPAENVRVEHNWNGGDMDISVSGTMRETSVFGPNLCLERVIWTRLGEKKIFIEDKVTNESDENSPLMFLYHVNIGWPILDDETSIIIPTRKVTPRDAEAEKDKDNYDVFHSPQMGYKEKVFFHDMAADPAGYVPVAVVNPHIRSLCMGLYIKYLIKELPRFTQWKMLGEKTYVLGIEPGNCGVLGRADERKKGTLKILRPGESQTFHLEIGVISTPEELNQVSDQVNLLLKR